MTKSCNNCGFAVFQDVGYSNYTVEGTDFSCALKKHPLGTFDRFYGEDRRLDYGAECDGHEWGAPPHMDVERENDLSAEQRGIWSMVYGN